MASDAEATRVLQAKYLDWCSARLVDGFLRLTPDEIYELAQRASAEAGADSVSAGKELSYDVLVARVTEALTARMQLPTFQEWQAAYEEAPAQFDHELAGFWRERS